VPGERRGGLWVAISCLAHIARIAATASCACDSQPCRAGKRFERFRAKEMMCRIGLQQVNDGFEGFKLGMMDWVVGS
jgi:hypothetical protein